MKTKNFTRVEAIEYLKSCELKPCWSFNKTGLCRKNKYCWFGHYCKNCNGAHPECNCPLK